MVNLARRPSTGEYRDLKKRLRSHKAGLKLDAKKALLAAERTHFERHFPASLIDPILEPTYGKAFAMSYEIRLCEKHPVFVGFISRGHREIRAFKKRKVFSKALEKLEEIERDYFSTGYFSNYLSAIIEKLRLDSPRSGEDIACLSAIKGPVHVDYTKRTDAACALLKRGYVLTGPSITELKRAKISIAGGNEEIISRLKKRPDLDYKIFLVFTKRPAGKIGSRAPTKGKREAKK